MRRSKHTRRLAAVSAPESRAPFTRRFGIGSARLFSFDCQSCVTAKALSVFSDPSSVRTVRWPHRHALELK